jgi:hypothetical protein
MEKDQEINVRCTNCWEGFNWQQSRTGDPSSECPRCGSNGQVIQGGFLVCSGRKRQPRRPYLAIDFTVIAVRPNFDRLDGAALKMQTVRPERR